MATAKPLHRVSACREAALEAADVGLSVIPVSPTKVPLLPWQDFQKRRPTPDEVEGWFDRWPHAMLGLLTGELNGVDVIDFDDLSPGWPPPECELPTHVVVATGGGGLHYYVPHVDGVRNSSRRLGRGVDVRGEGGYVVLPPSVSEKGAYSYNLGDVGAIAALRDEAVEPWLREALLAASNTDAPPPVFPTRGDLIFEGGRNDTLFRYGCRLRRAGLGEDAILAALRKLNASRCRPPAEEREVGRIARSAAGYPTAEDKGGLVLEDYPETDSGNAELIRDLYGDRIRHQHGSGRWFLYARHWWQLDRTCRVFRAARAGARWRHARVLQMPTHGDEETARKFRQARLRWARQSENDNRINAALRQLAAEPKIATVPEDWDASPTLVGTLNGVLDIETGDVRPGLPDDLISKHVHAAHDPDAACVRWRQFLEELFGHEDGLAAFLQRLAGYALAGQPTEQVWVLLHGRGANGKSVFLSTLHNVFGQYAGKLPFTALEAGSAGRIPNDLAALPGKRFVTSSESSDGSRFDSSRLKSLTGGEPISARFLHQEYFEFRFQGVLWLSANKLPRVQDYSDGFWRRCLLVPFERQFLGADADVHLADALAAEHSGILNWLVEGYWLYRERGLMIPDAVRAAVKEYRTDTDVVARFLEECCEKSLFQEVMAKDLYEAFGSWSGDQGVPEKRIMTQHTFGRRMAQQHDRFRHNSPGRPTAYRGLTLRAGS